MPKYLANVEMTCVTGRIPTATLDEIDKHILNAGLYRTYFLGAALILDSRMLARVFEVTALSLLVL